MSNNDRPKIAVIASCGLGDGLIFLIIANNLQKNGYDVTFYNNFTAQMQDWLPHISVKPYPHKGKILQEMSSYDLVLSEITTPLTKYFEPNQLRILNFVVILAATSRCSKDFVFDIKKRLTLKFNNSGKLEKLLKLSKANGFKVVQNKKLSMVESVALFCGKVLRLENALSDNGLTVPNANFIYRKYFKRVVIHPLSKDIKRIWISKKYIKLAKMLKKSGWNPVFIMSPKEKKTMPIFENSSFSVPNFETISELAAFIYESGWMIGNESGIGHLASSLHVPTLTITNKYKNHRWRPGWFHGIIVNCPCRVKFINKYFWKYFITVRKVFNVFNDFVASLNDI